MQNTKASVNPTFYQIWQQIESQHHDESFPPGVSGNQIFNYSLNTKGYKPDTGYPAWRKYLIDNEQSAFIGWKDDFLLMFDDVTGERALHQATVSDLPIYSGILFRKKYPYLQVFDD